MTSPSYVPALTGPTLTAAIQSASVERRTLIEGLLYEGSTLLLSAEGGCGKSSLIANVIAQASAGLPVFGALHVPLPLTCYYIPFERGAIEILERLKHMQTVIPFNPRFLHIFDNKQFPCPNLFDRHDQDFLLRSIEQDCPHLPPDVVIYDPIYQAVAGGLCDEDRVSIFIRFNVRLMAAFGCATWLNHHTGKTQYADGRPVEKDDPYYGSSYLRNHCTVSYHVKRLPEDEGDGTVWSRKKDNLDLCLKKFTLTYEPETYTSFLKDFPSGLAVSDRLLVALRQFKSEGKKVTFRQIQGCLMGVSTSHLRRLIETPPYSHLLTKFKNNGSSTLYEVTGTP